MAKIIAGRAKLEASGGITDSILRVIAETGVNDDFIGTNSGLSLVFSALNANGVCFHIRQRNYQE